MDEKCEYGGIGKPCECRLPVFAASSPLCPTDGRKANCCYHLWKYRAEVAEAALAALGNGWLPTSDAINALPEGVRRFVHDLETRCDPAGIVAENTVLHDQASQLQAALAAANKRIEAARGLVRGWGAVRGPCSLGAHWCADELAAAVGEPTDA